MPDLLDPGSAGQLPTAPPGTKPATPKFGEGSATALRQQLAALQQQLDDIMARIATRDAAAEPGDATGPRPSEQSAITALNTRIAALTQQITTAEAKGPQVVGGASAEAPFIVQQMPDGTFQSVPNPNYTAATAKPPAVLGGNSPQDQWIVTMRPDGTIDKAPNPNWDQATKKVQTVTAGGKIFTIDPDGKVTVAYTDQDAKQLADRQQAVAEANQRLAEARSKTEDLVARSRLDLEERVSKGEDAASVRAQQGQDLTAAHQEWVRADGDARRVQEEWRDYQTERHTTAAETLAREQFENTKAWQQRQDDLAKQGLEQRQREAEMAARTAAQQTRASVSNARLGAGGGYMGNVLQLLAQLNRDAPPGSSAVGDMVGPLLNVGRGFFSEMGGMADPFTETVAAPAQQLATQAAMATGQPPAAAANPALPGSAMPGVPPQAAAQQAMSTPLAPDGSPYVTPEYVAQVIAARRGGTGGRGALDSYPNAGGTQV